MHTRRMSLVTALLFTAALFLAVPGLLHSLRPVDDNRMDARLRPARQRTLTVWLLPGDMGDRSLITHACSTFEKQNPGARIFLRVVDAQELYAPTSVLPDLALFETGAVAAPERLFLPLDETDEPSGQWAGVTYALPLWMHVNVLSIPQSWFAAADTSTPRRASLLAAEPPARETAPPLAPDQAPWASLVLPGALDLPEGVALQQLLSLCPEALQPELTAALTRQSVPAASPTPQSLETTRPVSRGPTPTQTPVTVPAAKVQTLSQHRKALQSGEALYGWPLSPAVSDRVRYAALCRDGEDARAFLSFLRAYGDCADQGLLPACGKPETTDPLMESAASLFTVRTLPNAFAHTRQELLSLCADAFGRREDPVATLLRLR